MHLLVSLPPSRMANDGMCLVDKVRMSQLLWATHDRSADVYEAAMRDARVV